MRRFLSRFLALNARVWGVVLVLGSLVLHGAWAFADGYRVLTWFPTDDAFYYFTIARNILAGHGATFDGLGRTNGFHPLWMLLLLPLFTLYRFGPLAPLRAVILMVGLIHGLTGWVLYRAGRQVFHPWIALGLAASWTFGYLPWQLTAVGGMESGLNALAIATLWAVALAMHRARAYLDAKRLWAFGLALAFAFLSRLDTVFLDGAFGLWWLIQALRHAPGPWKRRVRGVARGLVPVLAPGLVLGGAYLAWNVFYVGSLIPTSARVKVLWGKLGPSPYGTPYGGNLFMRTVKSLFEPNLNQGPWAYAMYPITRLYAKGEPLLFPNPNEPTRAVRVALFYSPFLAAAALLLYLTRSLWWPLVPEGLLLPWFLGALAHGLYYDYTNHMAQRYWYWVPQMLFVHVFGALLIQGLVLAWAARRRWQPKALSAAMPLLVMLAFGLPFFHKAWPRPSGLPVEAHLYVEYARWVEAHTEPGALVAATGAGSLGYFVQGRRIVALDGLVGSPEYVRAWEQGRMVDYWREKGLDYVLINKGLRQSVIYRNLEPYLEGSYWYESSIEGWRIKLWRFRPGGTP